MNKISECLSKDWTKGEKLLLISTCLLFGMVLGFFLAPIKKGIYCGNYNGNNSYGEAIEDEIKKQ